jgi:very-short-patch-repair endonuclease/formate dehydrogenase assembly factor FdhD
LGSTRKKTISEINQYLHEKFPHISAVETQTYLNSKTKMVFICTHHGEFENTWNNITSGSHCQMCGRERLIKQVKSTTTSLDKVIITIQKIHNGHIEIVNPQDYRSTSSILKFRCSQNHPIWEVKVYGVLHGTGCPKCAGKNITTKEYIDQIQEIHQNRIKLVKGQVYKGRTIKMKYKCHNEEHPIFLATANNIIYNKSSCPKCKSEKISKALSFTSEEVYDKIKTLHKNKVIPFAAQKYKNQKTVWNFRCTEYPNHPSWKTNVGTVLNNENYIGCRYCIGENPITSKEDIINRIKEKFEEKLDIIHIHKHKKYTLKTKVEIWCKTHKTNHSEKLSNILKSKGCPVCSMESRSEKRKKDIEELITQVYKQHREFVEVVDPTQYKNIGTKIDFKCIKPKHGSFNSTPHLVIRGTGCPICSMSHGERKILFWLRDNSIDHIPQYRIRKSSESKFHFVYDFYLPELNILIEYDGRQHFEPVEAWGGQEALLQTQKNDQLKNELATTLGLKLIRISYKNKKDINNTLKNELRIFPIPSLRKES